MSTVTCNSCKKSYPDDLIPYRCACGGIYDYSEFPQYIPNNTISRKNGLSRYSTMLGLPSGCELITLGEGNTPLLPLQMNGIPAWLKMESQNPTGSYKDRGTTTLVSFLKSRDVDFAVEDSSGNAGASFAAYCAFAGIKARIFVPESASGPKRTQIEMYGAELISVPGARSESARVVLEEADRGVVYASHAWMPFGLTGIATIAYEIVEQLGQVPGSLIAPVGHGGLLYGIMRGFENMSKADFIPQEPYYIGVQANACAPLARAFEHRKVITDEFVPEETVAEGVKVISPARGSSILEKMQMGKGEIVSIDEETLLRSWRQSAKQGFYMEPTSALVWAALEQHIQNLKLPIVAVISGSGYKSVIPTKKE